MLALVLTSAGGSHASWLMLTAEHESVPNQFCNGHPRTRPTLNALAGIAFVCAPVPRRSPVRRSLPREKALPTY